MLARIREAARTDEGVGMVLVIAIVGIVTTLMAVMTTTAIRSLQSSRGHVSFESALSAAETGVDQILARSQRAYDVGGSDSYVTPDTTGTCSGSPVVWPFTTVPSADQEKSWARTQLLSLASNAACRSLTRSGEYVALKPQGHQTVYAMGWSPRYGANEVKSRIIKAEYLFTPYAPTNAILTSGSVTIEASTTVTTAPPADPSLASVHSNGQVVVQSGNPTVYGPVTQSGGGTIASSNRFYGNTGGTVAALPAQPIPGVSALQVWTRNHALNPPGGWYDLCADGTVRSPDGTAPCAGTLLASNTWRGWVYDGTGTVPVWEATGGLKTNGYSGTYYVDGGDAVAHSGNAGSPVPNLTVIAASSTTSCNKVAGNIDWNVIDPAAPSIPNLFMLADQDLLTHSNYQAGSASGGTVVSGLFIAGDQVELQTSSTGAYGAVVAADQCDPADGTSLVDYNVVKNPSVYYDPNGQAPFIDIINTTLWLEYGA
jgi:hypothetical protein